VRAGAACYRPAVRKLLVMSIMIITFVVPIMAAARHADVNKGLTWTKKRFALFCAVYVVTILYVVPRL
jgi:hypothetical protein